MRLFSPLVISLLLTGTLAAAPPVLTHPARVDMSAEKLDEAVAIFKKAIAADDLRNVVLLVARNGKTVLHQAIGWRNKETRLPMEPDNLLRMASNTKAAVATGILILAEEKSWTWRTRSACTCLLLTMTSTSRSRSDTCSAIRVACGSRRSFLTP